MKKRYNKLRNNGPSLGDEFVLVPQKSIMLWLALGVGGMLISAGIFLVITANDPELCLYPPSVERIIGTFTIILGFYSAVTFISNFISPKPMLIANENGIYLCKVDALIPWDCVKEFSIVEIKNPYTAFIPSPKTLVIDVKNYNQITTHFTFYKKALLAIGGKSFAVGIIGYGHKAEYVKYILENYLKKYIVN